MLSAVKNKLLTPTEIISLEINLEENGLFTICGVHVSSKAKQLVKIAEHTHLKQMEQLASRLPQKIPLVLCFNGKGILLREQQETEAEQHLTSLLPGVNPSEFYHQSLTAGGKRYTFIARKPIIDEWLTRFTEKGYQVIDIQLGAGNLHNLLPFLPPTMATYTGHSLSFQVQQATLSKVYPTPAGATSEEVLTGNLYFQSSSLIALGNALQTFVHTISSLPPGLPVPALDQNKKNLSFHKYQTAFGWFTLISLLSILIINYIFFDHYFTRNQALASVILLNQEKSMMEQKLKEKIDSDFHYLQTLGWDKNSKHSYFADRVAALVPETIVLTSLNNHPLKEDDNNTHSQTFEQHQLILTGKSDDPSDLNQFVNAIRNIEEVNAVSLKSYLYKRETQNGQFIIEINHD